MPPSFRPANQQINVWWLAFGLGLVVDFLGLSGSFVEKKGFRLGLGFFCVDSPLGSVGWFCWTHQAQGRKLTPKTPLKQWLYTPLKLTECCPLKKFQCLVQKKSFPFENKKTHIGHRPSSLLSVSGISHGSTISCIGPKYTTFSLQGRSKPSAFVSGGVLIAR